MGVNEGGSLRLRGDLTVDGGTLNVGDHFAASLGILGESQTITLVNDAQVDIGFNMLMPPGAMLRMESGADLTVGGLLTLGQSQQQITRFEINGGLFDPVAVDVSSLTVGGNQGLGILDIRDGTVTTSIANVANGTGFNTNGLLEIRSRGELVAEGFGLEIATNAGDTTSGTVRVHSGGQLTVPSLGGIEIGHNSMGSALLDVRTGGVVTTNGTTNVVRASGNLDVRGTFTASGEVQVDGGTVHLVGNGRFAADTVTVTNGGEFKFEGGELNVSTFTGDLHNQLGTLAPGGSGGPDTFGITTIVGQYTQESNSLLSIELGGNSAITEHDLVSISGAGDSGWRIEHSPGRLHAGTNRHLHRLGCRGWNRWRVRQCHHWATSQ